MIVCKCLRKLSPSYLSSQFEFIHNSHSHLTRGHTSNTLAAPKFNSNSGLRTFHVRAAYAWLPSTVRTEVINMSVKIQIKNSPNLIVYLFLYLMKFSIIYCKSILLCKLFVKYECSY